MTFQKNPNSTKSVEKSTIPGWLKLSKKEMFSWTTLKTFPKLNEIA